MANATKTLSLQRRHFEFIAEVLKDLRKTDCCQRTLDAIVAEFMRQLPRTNSRFNADRFERATQWGQQ